MNLFRPYQSQLILLLLVYLGKFPLVRVPKKRTLYAPLVSIINIDDGKKGSPRTHKFQSFPSYFQIKFSKSTREISLSEINFQLRTSISEI